MKETSNRFLKILISYEILDLYVKVFHKFKEWL